MSGAEERTEGDAGDGGAPGALLEPYWAEPDVVRGG
jgi:hypothetical protein